MNSVAGTNTSNNSLCKWPGGNIFLLGFMGSGKTHWGKIWAEANQLSFLDLDQAIENKAAKSIADIFEQAGEDYFRMLEAEVLRESTGTETTIVACGGGTPCFFENMLWMNEQGVTIYLAAEPPEILIRLSAEQEKRPLLKKLNQTELLIFIEQKIKEREPFYKMAHIEIESGSLTENSLPGILSTITF